MPRLGTHIDVSDAITCRRGISRIPQCNTIRQHFVRNPSGIRIIRTQRFGHHKLPHAHLSCHEFCTLLLHKVKGPHHISLVQEHLHGASKDGFDDRRIVSSLQRNPHILVNIVVCVLFIHVSRIALFREHEKRVKALVKLKVVRRRKHLADEVTRLSCDVNGRLTRLTALQTLSCLRIARIEFYKERIRIVNNKPFGSRLKVMIVRCEIIDHGLAMLGRDKNIRTPNNIALWIQRGEKACSHNGLTRRDHLPRSRQKRMIARNINPPHGQEDAVNLLGRRKAVTDDTMDPCPARFGPTPASFQFIELFVSFYVPSLSRLQGMEGVNRYRPERGICGRSHTWLLLHPNGRVTRHRVAIHYFRHTACRTTRIL